MNYYLLIDKKYPFENGEPFLESELACDTGAIDKILIFPIDICPGSKLTRTVPEKAEVYVTARLHRKAYRFYIGLKSIPGALKKAAGDTVRYNGYRPSLKSRWFAACFQNICADRAEKILNILRQFPFRRDDRVVLCAYWLYTPAAIALTVRQYFTDLGITVKAVSRAHRFDLYNTALPYKKETIEGLDGIFPCSEDGTAFLKANYRMPDGRLQTAYLGTADYGVADYAFSEKIFRIVSCSRLTDVKRVERIGQALRLLDSECTHRKIVWTHIGDGPDRKKLEAVIARPFQNIEVRLLGAVPNREVYRFYAENSTDLFLNVSSSEGLPVSVMEAASFGIPVIATDVGGTDEIVVDGCNGLLLSEDFSDGDLKQAILALYKSDKARILSLRQHSRQLWKKSFYAMDNYKQFYLTLFK